MGDVWGKMGGFGDGWGVWGGSVENGREDKGGARWGVSGGRGDGGVRVWGVGVVGRMDTGWGGEDVRWGGAE